MFVLAARRCFVLTVLLSMLSACQTAPPKTSSPKDEPGWQSGVDIFEGAKLDYQSLPSWRYSAKVGLTTPNVTEAANIVWEFSDQANTVRLFGPLGIGAVRLQFDRYGVVLSDKHGVRHRGASAEALLTRIAGWPIPIEALSHWLFLLPSPEGVFRYRLNESFALVELEQLGWNIKYSGYKAYGEKLLPRKIVATKILASGEKVVVKLITKTWQWQ